MKARIQAHGAPGDVMQGLRPRAHSGGREHLPGRPLPGEPAPPPARLLRGPRLRQAPRVVGDLHLAAHSALRDHTRADEAGHRRGPARRPQPHRQPRLLVLAAPGGGARLVLLRLHRGQPHEHLVAALPAPRALHPEDVRAVAGGRGREPGGRLPPGGRPLRAVRRGRPAHRRRGRGAARRGPPPGPAARGLRLRHGPRSRARRRSRGSRRASCGRAPGATPS